MERMLGKALISLFLLAAVGFAQTGAGNIQGAVKDATGAVVPGARVTVTQTRTSLATTTVTNEVGFYLFPSAQLGPYQISVDAPGMERWQGELTLMAGQSAEVNVALKVGATTTEVTVMGNVTPLITTNSPTLATVIERTRLEMMSLNGRVITNLIYMTTPGLEAGSVPRVYGLRYASQMLQDGAALENREWSQLPERLPGIDSIEEFRTETSNSSAKMNRPGTILLTTRAGANQLHGAVFHTARNSAIGVARRREDYYLKPPHLVRNEFGASLGGPVRLPKIYDGNNKTFFFFSFEGYRLRRAITGSASLPTPAMRGGDFSGLIDGQGRLQRLHDPNTTTPTTWQRALFPNNGIPISRQSPLARYLYSVTPLPTTADNPLVAANWFGAGFNNSNQHTETARVDHRLSDRDQLFFRYSHNPSYIEATSGGPFTLDRKANANTNNNQNDSGVANWTHTFSPTFFSETMVTVSRDYKTLFPYTGSEEISTTLGLPNPLGGIGFPRIVNNGFSGNTYDSTINPHIDYSLIYNFDQNFTKVKGRHELQFGMRLRFETVNIQPDQQEKQGFVDFRTLATSLYDPGSGSAFGAVPNTGHVGANMFLGMASYSARFTRPWFEFTAAERSGYFQDNFRVNSRLTLNLGVRYEYNTPIKERHNTLIGFNPKTKAAVLPASVDEFARRGLLLPSLAQAYARQGFVYETPEQAGLPEAMAYSNKWDFGPRVGFAYRLGPLDRPMVVRGGYSIFAYPESIRLVDSSMRANVPTTGQISNDPNLAAQSPDGRPNYLLRSVPTIIAGLNSSKALTADNVSSIPRGTGVMYFLDPYNPTARAHQWNLTVEREILADTSLKIGYVGTHGSRIFQHYALNDAVNDYVWYVSAGEPLPTGEFAGVARRTFDQEKWGTITRIQKTGWSNNSSFQIEAQRRFSKGYGYQVFYIMSNAMRAGGDGWRDDILRPSNFYAPGAVPAGDDQRSRFLFYRRDIGIPKHRMNWNWIVDLPFGKGKPLGRNAGGFLNALIGGWQIAGYGQLFSRYFTLPTSNWGPVRDIEVYGKKYPIQDCRSGVCYDGWLYWNGYIPAHRINSVDRNGRPNGVMGVPDTYRPSQTPIIPTPKNGGSSADPLFAFYETNTVWVPLKNGTLQRTTQNPAVHPLQNQYVLGPMRWNMSASAFKTVQIKEQVLAHFSVAFLDNVFNMPGTILPGGDGVILNRTSDNPARVLQLTLRLSW